ncbi:glycosyltransferase family 2 protein [Muribaculum intestinale]|uniref:glycosyltransferase family 2 protein n=2 Tax=Muribaculum intestinale TaxID=1796646 RepID=UPI0026236C53|nr:glycosyltransferase family 2 protein [Muribaculum intestinale]
MNDRLKISVITVCYNAAESIEETILSVINQTYSNLEYIIIDGGSTDSTVDIIKKYANRIAYWISEPDKGIYDAMNKGIAVATGDYINFMNSGDRFSCNLVLRKIQEFIDPERMDIIFGDHYSVNNNNVKYCNAKKIRLLNRGMPFCHQAAFTRLSYHKSNPFDISFKIYADRVFFRKALLEDNRQFFYTNTPICYFDCSSGMSHDNINSLYKERYRYWGIENSRIKKLPYELIRLGVLLKKKIISWRY